MRRSLYRFLAVPVVSAGVLAGVVVAAPSALAVTDTSGTVTVTVPLSYLQQLAKAGVVAFPVPLSEATIDKTNNTAVVTFPVTGGNGDVRVLNGSLNLGGTIDVASASGTEVTFGSLQLNIRQAVIEGTPSGSSTPVKLLDLTGISGVQGDPAQSLNARGLNVDPAGASYVDSALSTSVFTAGQDVGTLSASWNISV